MMFSVFKTIFIWIYGYFYNFFLVVYRYLYDRLKVLVSVFKRLIEVEVYFVKPLKFNLKFALSVTKEVQKIWLIIHFKFRKK